MEDLWKEFNVVNDEEKKESIGKYADKKVRRNGKLWECLRRDIPGDSSKKSLWKTIQKQQQQRAEHQHRSGSCVRKQKGSD